MINFLRDLKDNNILPDRILPPALYERTAPEINRGEILRYAGIPAAILRARGEGKKDESYLDENGNSTIPADPELTGRLEDVIKLAEGQLTFRISYVCAGLGWTGDGYPILPFEQKSSDLKRNLEGCSGVIIFAATIGAGIDRLIRRYERTEAATGLLLQGMGAERVETFVDTFNDEVREAAKKAGLIAHPRYSPGYGDLPISLQPDLLKLVDAQRRLGITINTSFLMSPSKSVTAIIGIEQGP